jgi:hypothetical protein
MPRSLARLSASELSYRDLSLAVFITNIVESDFRYAHPGEWLRDPKLFDQVLTAIVHALIWFKPSGGRDEQFLFYNSIAEQIIDEIRSADPSLPITKRSTRQHAMATLKDKLGDLARHRHPYDDWREKEPPVRIVVPNPAKRKHK